MEKINFHEIAAKYSQNEATQNEQEIFESFLDKMQEQNKHLIPIDNPERSKIIYAKIAQELQFPSTVAPKFFRWKAFAAAVCFLLMGTYFVKNNWYTKNSIETQNGEIKTIVLADGSEITLNAQSKLEYPSQFGETREINFEGEAYFKIHRDTAHPFIIHTNHYTTRVLGTSFNINSRKTNEINVSVNTGIVSVTSKNWKRNPIRLIKNQMITVVNDKITQMQNIQSAQYTTWILKNIVLKNTSFLELKKILENSYGQEIILKDKSLEKETFSGQFKKESFENVLKSIAIIKNLTFEKNNQNAYVIKRKQE